MVKPVIHYDKVKDSKVLQDAMDVCPAGVFAKEGDKIIVKNPDKCIGCRACEGVAENGEVTVE